MDCSPLRLQDLTNSLQPHSEPFPDRLLLVAAIRALSGILLPACSLGLASLMNFAILKQDNMVPVQTQRIFFHFLDRY